MTVLKIALCIIGAFILICILAVGGLMWRINQQYNTPMVQAIQRGDIARVQYMITRRPELVNSEAVGIKGDTHPVLCIAIEKNKRDIALLLLRKHADPNKSSGFNETPLYLAVKNGDVVLIRELVRHGAKVSQPAEWGKTPLYLAIEEHRWKVVDVLRQSGAKDVPLVFEAVARHDLNTLRREISQNRSLVSMHDSQGLTLLHWAAKEDNPDAVKLLVDKGADIEAVITKGLKSDDTPVMTACKNGSLEAVKALVEAKATLVNPAPGVPNCLFSAVWSGDTKLMEYLLDLGLDPNPADSSIVEALDYAPTDRQGVELAKLLVSRGLIIRKATVENCVGRGCFDDMPELTRYMRQHAKP